MPRAFQRLGRWLYVLSGGDAVSLRRRLTVFLTAYLALTFLMLTMGILQLEHQQALSQVHDQATGLTKEFAKAIHQAWELSRPADENRKALHATGIEAHLARYPNIVYAVFQDTANHIQHTPKQFSTFSWIIPRTTLGHLTKARLAMVGSATRTFSERPHQQVTEFLIRVQGKDNAPLGVVRVGLAEAASPPFLGHVTKQTLGTLLAVNVLAVLAACLLTFLVASRLERAIRALLMRTRRLVGQPSGGRGGETIGGPQNVLTLLTEEFDGIERLIDRLKQHRMELAQTLSHELRSPMQAIQGYADFLRRGGAGPINPTIEAYLNIMAENAERFEGFINNVLDLVRIDGGRLPVMASPFDAAAVVEKSVQLFQGQAQESGVRLVTELSLEANHPVGDPNRTLQVLINLVSNALKFTPQGGLIKIGAIGQDGVVRFFVQDNGPGIPESQRSKVFEEFYQVPDLKPARGATGIGIGLTLCKRIVEAQGGRIWIERGEGAGTMVCFTLPRTQAIQIT